MSEAVMEKKSATLKAANGPKIDLSTFVTYNQAGDRMEFFPAPRQTFNNVKTGENILIVGDVPLPPGVPIPEGLTLLCGFGDQLDELHSQYVAARAKGHELVKVEIKYDVGTGAADRKIVVGTVNLDNLHLCKNLNISRLAKGVRQVHVIDEFNRLLREEAQNRGIAPDFAEDIYGVGARPDLLVKVFKNSKIFAHINSIVYNVPDGSPRGRKVCTIFETHSVSDVRVRGEAPFKVELPKI